MNAKLVIALIGMVIGSAGLVWLAVLTDWKIALAVFIMIFGNNLEQRSRKQ